MNIYYFSFLVRNDNKPVVPFMEQQDIHYKKYKGIIVERDENSARKTIFEKIVNDFVTLEEGDNPSDFIQEGEIKLLNPNSSNLYFERDGYNGSIL